MSRWGAPKMTRAQNKGQMLDFLYNCRPAALASVTADQLVARHGVDRKSAEYELVIARQKRAGEAA